MTGEPEPVRCWAPTEHCRPLDGEDYTDVPTEHSGRPAPGGWLLALPHDADEPPVLHRGDCASIEGQAVSTTARQLAKHQDEVVRCDVCRPAKLNRART